jgi:hypothetical protein
MATLRTGPDLGWTAGQDVTSVIAEALAAISPGDRFVLSHPHELTGGPYTLPGGVTYDAVVGAGFDVMDPDRTASAGDVFRLGGDDITIRNWTGRMSTAIDWSVLAPTTNPGLNTYFNARRFIVGSGRNGLTIENCDFDFNGKAIVVLDDCDGLRVRHTRFRGAQWTFTLYQCHDAEWEYCLWDGGPSEGIKTVPAGFTPTKGCKNLRVRHCLFRGLMRDGVDTTGGFWDSVIEDCIFYRNAYGGVGGGVDIKAAHENNQIPHPNVVNENIRIERCRFIDTRHAVVVSITDPPPYEVTLENESFAIPNNIRVDECSFERTPSGAYEVSRALTKGGRDIQFTNSTIKGTVTAPTNLSPSTAGAPGTFWDAGLTLPNTDLSGDTPTSLAAEEYEDVVPFAYGPQEAPPPMFFDFRTAGRLFTQGKEVDRLYAPALIWSRAADEPEEPPNLLVNGNFSDGTNGWLLGAGWSLDGDELVWTYDGANTQATQNLSPALIAGNRYKVTATLVSITAATTRVYLAGGASLFYAQRSAPGVYVETLTATHNHNSFRVQGSVVASFRWRDFILQDLGPA